MLHMFPQDKANHAIYGAAAGLMGILVAVGCGFGSFAPLTAIGFSVILGAAKETSDIWLNYQAEKQHLPLPHEVSWEDFVATCCGGIFSAVCNVF